MRTDNHITNSAEFTESIRGDVEAAIGSRFGNRLRRVEVYLEDMNAEKRGIDTRCSVEIHLAGHPAIAAESRAADIETALDMAVDRVLWMIEKQPRAAGRPRRARLRGRRRPVTQSGNQLNAARTALSRTPSSRWRCSTARSTRRA